MDISLNVTNTTKKVAPKNVKKMPVTNQKTPYNIAKLNQNNSMNEEFSFNFNKGCKVKGIVKRISGTSIHEKGVDAVKCNQTQQNSQPSAIINPLKRKKLLENSKLNEAKRVKKSKVVNPAMLNKAGTPAVQGKLLQKKSIGTNLKLNKQKIENIQEERKTSITDDQFKKPEMVVACSNGLETEQTATTPKVKVRFISIKKHPKITKGERKKTKKAGLRAVQNEVQKRKSLGNKLKQSFVETGLQAQSKSITAKVETDIILNVVTKMPETTNSLEKTHLSSFVTNKNLKNSEVDDNKLNTLNTPKNRVGKVDLKAKMSNAFRVERPEDYLKHKKDLFSEKSEIKVMGQKFVKPVIEQLFTGTPVSSLQLQPMTVNNLVTQLGITQLTNVQEQAIPKILTGKDLLIRAQTGSGKTLAYALPLVEKLQCVIPKIRREAGIHAVVIVPTRELALQTYELFSKLLKPYIVLVPGILMGGENRKTEKARIRRGINILVGTPGRLADHLSTTENFKLNNVRFLVIDEADLLLDMGYEKDVKKIVEAIEEQRSSAENDTQKSNLPHLQRLLLSATLTNAVKNLAGLTLREPTFIDCSSDQPSPIIAAKNDNSKPATAEDQYSIPENLKLSYVLVPPKLRLVTLSGVLVGEFSRMPKLKVVVFMSTREMVNYHHALFTEVLTDKVLDEDDEQATREQEKCLKNKVEQPLLKGVRLFKLFGTMRQTDRQAVFNSFRKCESGVLIATDVAGRGVDIPEVDLVIQYTPPQKLDDFVHRVGRTARAGRSGRALLFLSPREQHFVRILEEKRIRISQDEIDDCLQGLYKADKHADSFQNAAAQLQKKYLYLVADDNELKKSASLAFLSWMKFYAGFPKDLKVIFNCKNAHVGHFAKGFGLMEAPTQITKKFISDEPRGLINKLTFSENVIVDKRKPGSLNSLSGHKNKLKRFSTKVTNQSRTPHLSLKSANEHTNSMRFSEFSSGLTDGKLKNQKKGVPQYKNAHVGNFPKRIGHSGAPTKITENLRTD